MLCFVGFRIFGLVYFKLHSTGRYSCITAPQLHFYSQHWTRLANIQTNTQARLELTKQGLQSFFEGLPYMLKQNFPSQTCREWFIELCAWGPDFAARNECPAMLSNIYNTYFCILKMNIFSNIKIMNQLHWCILHSEKCNSWKNVQIDKCKFKWTEFWCSIPTTWRARHNV